MLRAIRKTKGRRSAVTLRRKMLLGYGVAFALMALVIGWATVHLASLGRATDSILRQNYRSIDASWMMRDALHRQSEALLADADSLPGAPPAFGSAEADFLFWLGKAEDNITVAGEESAVAAISARYRAYLEAAASFDASVQGAGSYPGTVAPFAAGVDSALAVLLEINQAAMNSASQRAASMASRGSRSTLAVGGLGLAVGILFSLLLSGRILRPLYLTIPAARRLAAGDYTSRVPERGSDELGLLAREFNSMAEQLRKFDSLHVDRLLSEKSKTEAILNGIDDGIILVDNELRVLDMNPAAASLLGTNWTGPSRKPHLSEIIRSERLVSEARSVSGGAEPASSPEEERTLELERGKSRIYLLFSAIPLEHSGESLPGCVIVLRDVTRTRELDRMKSEFVMAAAHELRTPITSIGMSVDLLVDHCAAALEPRDRELLEAAHDEVHRLKSLVNDLLDLSRIEAGRIDLVVESVPVRLLFERVERIFEGQISQKRIDLSVEAAEDGLEVMADPNKIAWVLTNLVSNAMRYVPEGAGCISLGARRIGGSVQISVSDNGPGIPADHQTRIFQKFVQFDIDGKAGGSGLGLAICREVVRASGGTIWVESEPGKGTTFVFTLPVPSRVDGG
jgi:NtrC-family two-component system sensor histidine kinase KinB